MTVELDGAPGVRGDALVEIVGQLIRTQGVDLPIEMFAHGADGSETGRRLASGLDAWFGAQSPTHRQRQQPILDSHGLHLVAR